MLAAGGSRRLAEPKQLVREGPGGRTLLRRAAQTACEAACGPVVVVLGAADDTLREQLAGLAVEIVANPRWADGLSTSVGAGLAAVERAAAAAALFMTCDQPKVTPELLRRLVERWASAHPPAVACAYAGTVGVPALFDRAAFPALRRLSGDQGAKPVLEAYGARVLRVPFEDAADDLDTPSDARRLTGGV